MKTHRILGILWLALCCYSTFNLLRALLELHPTDSGLWVAWFVFASSCLLYLVGIVASIFLFRGTSWARWFIAVVAVWMALFAIAYIVTSKSFHVWSSISIVFAVVSIVLLFLPKHERVA